MKKKLISILVASVIVATSFVSPFASNVLAAEESRYELNTNLIKNGDFENGIGKWDSYTAEGGKGTVSVEDGKLKTNIKNIGDLNYSVQASCGGFALHKGGKYVLKFDISSSVDREMYYCIQLNSGDYHSYVGEQLTLTPETQSVTAEFTMKDDTDLCPKLVFNMGNYESELPEHNVYIDNVELCLVDDSHIDEEANEKEEDKIVLNQLGYLPTDAKKVVFRGENVDKSFNVVSVDTNEVVYTGKMSEGVYNSAAKETDYTGDFSQVTKEGKYKITTETMGDSYEFEIGKEVYKNVLKDAVRMFYMQRCSELPEQYAGKWAHPECHTDLATIYGTDKKIDVSGGWHDAGDYGRYVVATSKTVADLFLSYDANKDSFGDDTNIPESGNGMADILDEIKGQTDWLFKMQNKENGGVYHKVTCANFPGTIMPEEEKGKLIVCPETTTATGDFAAVMAMAYNHFKDIDKDYANKCLEAAEAAWDYLDAQPSQKVVNPEGIVTGEYGDTSDRDERYWAAAELYKVTGKTKYHEKFKQLANEKVEIGYDWQLVGNFGNEAYLSSLNTDKAIVNKIKASIIKDADRILKGSMSDPYGIALGSNFYWGSSMAVTNEAIILDQANRISPKSEYVEYAKEHINYCFGKNANAMSFVTGYGTVAPKNPHHRPSQVVKEAIPGMIVGGVNSNLEDDCAAAYLATAAPAKCYIDKEESYSTNEVDIYWNSSLVHALSKLQMVPVGKTTTDKPSTGETDKVMDSNVDVTVNTNVNNSIDQVYTIKAKDEQKVDLSKLKIRSYYSKSNNKDMAFHCYNASANISKAPWYVDFTNGTVGTFGSDSKGTYVDISFTDAIDLTKGSASVNVQTSIANNDWSSDNNFKAEGFDVYYDGALLR